MREGQFVSRSLAATSIFLCLFSWILILVICPLLILNIPPWSHPQLDAFTHEFAVPLVIMLYVGFGYLCAFAAKRVSNRNRFIIGVLGIFALVKSYYILQEINLPFPPYEEQKAIGIMNIFDSVLLLCIGTVLLTCTVILTLRRTRHGKSLQVSEG